MNEPNDLSTWLFVCLYVTIGISVIASVTIIFAGWVEGIKRKARRKSSGAGQV